MINRLLTFFKPSSMQYCGLELGHPIAHVSTSVCGLLVTVLTATEDVSSALCLFYAFFVFFGTPRVC
jgi:hypothetical protein